MAVRLSSESPRRSSKDGPENEAFLTPNVLNTGCVSLEPQWDSSSEDKSRFINSSAKASGAKAELASANEAYLANISG